MFDVCDISYNPRPIKMYIHKIQKKKRNITDKIHETKNV